MNTKFLILAGGTGARLWPLSRKLYAKQFLPLTGEQSLLQNTVCRLMKRFDRSHIYIVTNNESKFLAESQIRQADEHFPSDHILTEPYSRNTFFSLLYSLTKFADNDIVTVLPADHFVRDPHILIQTVENAISQCDDIHLTVYGFDTEYISRNYGYILPKGSVSSDRICEVSDFREKPDIDEALHLIDSGYLVNAGMMTFRPSALMQQLKQHNSAGYDIYQRLVSGQPVNTDNIPDISIDKALLEHSDKLRMIYLDCGLRDISSFSSLYNTLPHDETGNSVVGEADNLINIDSSGSLILTDNRQIVTIGTTDLVIADTKDALLVAHRDRAEDIEHAMDLLRNRNETLLNVHKTAYRPWGSYTILDCGEGYQVKRLTIDPCKKISLQYHKHRSETWTVVGGVAEVVKDTEYLTLFRSESVFIPANTSHRLYNPLTKVPLTVIEVQTGDYLGEDDIIRIEDDFDRV